MFTPFVLAHAAETTAKGFGPHFIQWVGHFHPPLTVFPIAMLLGAALAELLRLRWDSAWLDGGSRWCVTLGALGAIVTVPLGWAFATIHHDSWMLEVHRWLGTAAGAGAVVIWFLSEMSRRPGRTGWLVAFRTLLFVAVPLVIATGFFGGAMVYTIHEYDWNPPQHQTELNATATSQPAGQPLIIQMTDDDVFQPAKLTIAAGATVQWKNVSQDTHTVTNDPNVAADATDVSMPPGVKPFNSGKIRPGQTFEYHFITPGTYKYICEPHEAMGMMGQIEVKPAAP